MVWGDRGGQHNITGPWKWLLSSFLFVFVFVFLFFLALHIFK